MKLLPIVSGTLAAGLAVATVWTSDNGLTLSAKHWQGVQAKDLSRSFKLKGDVVLDSMPDGLNIRSEFLDCRAEPNPKNPKAYLIRQAIARQNVRIVKTVVNPNGKQITDIEGPVAKYVLGTSESVVTMTGATSIKTIDESQRQTMAATGSSGVAHLDPAVRVANGNGLRRATLEGPVHAKFNQEATKTAAASAITATSSQMTLENDGPRRKITMVGNVHLNGPDIGDAKGVERAVFVMGENRTWQLEATSSK